MLFNKAFALPVALLAGASFAFAQQGGVAPQASKAELVQADSVLKAAGSDVIHGQTYLISVIEVKKPDVPNVENAKTGLLGILNTLTIAETNLTAPAPDAIYSDPSGHFPNQVEVSVLLSDILNSLVPSARLVKTLDGNPLSLDLDRVTAKTLDVLKLCCDRLHVALPAVILKHVAEPNSLADVSAGFKTISAYLNGAYPAIP